MITNANDYVRTVTNGETSDCGSCTHQAVCNLKEKFNAIKAQMSDVLIPTGDNSIAHVKDMEWVETTVRCAHYMSDGRVRGGF